MHTSQGTIVVGIDGSESSSHALRWAARRAAEEHRELTIVHTVEAVTPPHLDAAVVAASSTQQALHQEGDEVLATARAEAGRSAPGLEIHHVLGVSEPEDLLVWMSESAAMVVVGSHGRGPLRSALLGSVGVALVRRTHCPVVVVRPSHVGAVRHGVVVGFDALPESRAVLELAYREASIRGLPLTVLHCGDDAVAERRVLAEAMAGMTEKYPDVTVTTTLTQAGPQDALTTASERMDLVVVGSHQAAGLERARHPSVAVAVVEHAACPVAVVPLRA